jgi:hypothetical protein
MSKIHIGPHTELRRDPDEVGAAEHPASEQFDREISLRGIFWTGALVIGITVLSAVVVWFILAGFRKVEDRRQPEPSPLLEANRVVQPPDPRLQTAPEVELRHMRAEEDLVLLRAGWVDQRQGTVRVPIDVAMEMIAARGLGPEAVGGNPADAAGGAVTTPADAMVQTQGRPSTPAGPAPGANVQMSRQPQMLGTAPPPPSSPPPSERR